MCLNILCKLKLGIIVTTNLYFDFKTFNLTDIMRISGIFIVHPLKHCFIKNNQQAYFI